MNINPKNFDELLSCVAARIPRMTDSLRALLTVFFESPRPLSVSEILQELSQRKEIMNKVTVYRKLEVLKSAGILEEVLLSGERRYYELAREHHHHLICLECECMEDWQPDESLLQEQERSLEERGFIVKHHSFELFGVCRNCQ